MVSTRKMGGLYITIGAGGLRFKKRKSAFNAQIGKCMADSGVTPAALSEAGDGTGGRNSVRFQNQFVKCVARAQTKDGNRANLRASTKEKYGV